MITLKFIKMCLLLFFSVTWKSVDSLWQLFVKNVKLQDTAQMIAK